MTVPFSITPPTTYLPICSTPFAVAASKIVFGAKIPLKESGKSGCHAVEDKRKNVCKHQLNDGDKSAYYKELNELPKSLHKRALFLCGVVYTAEAYFFFLSAIVLLLLMRFRKR